MCIQRIRTVLLSTSTCILSYSPGDAGVLAGQCSVVSESDRSSQRHSATAAQHHSALTALSSAPSQSRTGRHPISITQLSLLCPQLPHKVVQVDTPSFYNF